MDRREDKGFTEDGERTRVQTPTPTTLAAVGTLLVLVAGPLAATTAPAAYGVAVEPGFPGVTADELSPDARELVRATVGERRNLSTDAYPSSLPRPDLDDDERFLVRLNGRVLVARADWPDTGTLRLSVADRTESVLLDRTALSPEARAVIDRARARDGSAAVYGPRPSALRGGITPDSLLYLETEAFVVTDGDATLTVSVTDPIRLVPPIGHWLATLGVFLGGFALVPATVRVASRRAGLVVGWLAGVCVVFVPVALADPVVAHGLPLDTITVARLADRLPVVAAVALLAGTIGVWRA